VAVLVRGDREINEIKLTNHLDVQHLTLASEDKVREATKAPVGFAGPVGLSGLRIVADETVRNMSDFATGANKEDAHYTGVNWGRDAELSEFADLLLVSGGDPCPRCEGTLELFRGIEVGHIFKLGTKYSKALGCNFTDEDGQEQPMIMGCYGLGIGRTVAAAIEQNHGADGIIWPRPLAPFEALLAALNPDDGEVRRVAEQIYGQLLEKGIEVLYDDRDERPGVKFKDADLIGFPVRVVVGAKSLADGKVEVSLRRDRQRQLVPVVEAVPRVMELLREKPIEAAIVRPRTARAPMTKGWILASLVLLLPLQAAAAPTGLNLAISVDLEKAARPQTALKEAEQVIARRLAEAGVPDAVVNPSGKDRLSIMIPRTKDPEQILRLVQTTGFLELRFVRFPPLGGMASEEVLYHFGGRLPADLELLEQRVRGDDGWAIRKMSYAVERRPVITGADIETAQPGLGQLNNPIVEFRLTEDAAEVFGRATEAHIGSPLAFVLDGEVISAPVIPARIGKDGVIEGRFTESEAQELAMLLRSGPLPAPVELIGEHGSRSLPSRELRYLILGGCAMAFLLFVAMLVWLYRRSDPARRTPR
jgi:protein-export membrane protein SecD